MKNNPFTGNIEPKIRVQEIETDESYITVPRTLPLECCGLIIHFDIGVIGLSLEGAKKYVNEFNKKDFVLPVG